MRIGEGFFEDPSWLAPGFKLLKHQAGYQRTDGCHGRASGYGRRPHHCQSEHSERAVLPTGLSLKPSPPADRDMLGRRKPEGSDTYVRSTIWLDCKHSTRRRLELVTGREDSGYSAGPGAVEVGDPGEHARQFC